MWIKWHPVDWLHSTCRDELTPAERATFQDYVCMASIREPLGEFRVSSLEALARQLNTPINIIESTNKKCVNAKRIIVEKKENEYVFKIIKYYVYQSLSPYKEKNVNKKTKKKGKKFTKSHTRDRVETEKRRDRKDKERKHIIDYFNEMTGQKRGYLCNETNKMINGRLNNGKTFEDFKHVIDTKTSQWLHDEKMRRYLRPSTLFREGNFEDYLNEPYENPREKKLNKKEAELKVGKAPHREKSKEEIKREEAIEAKRKELLEKCKTDIEKARKEKNVDRLEEIDNYIKTEVAKFSLREV